jgi:tRNA-Thr(GGU) m(6)t(6)A37 methyltransferase TsaA
MENSVNITPIGVLNCNFNYRFEQPRQGEFAKNSGVITLNQNENFEQALEDLDGFDYIWIIYLFHKNSSWKPKVSPPVNPNNKKKGVFATRSPHRPNPIGMSCVKLISVNGRNIKIEDFDLLNGTPILDIKPYVSTYDSYPNAKRGWIPIPNLETYQLYFSTIFLEQVSWILEKTSFDLRSFCEVQLSNTPLSTKKKRVTLNSPNSATIAFRTWRINYLVDVDKNEVSIQDIFSGYSTDDLFEKFDKYEDKEIHREFSLLFKHN